MNEGWCNTQHVYGHEGSCRDILTHEVTAYNVEIRIDAFGNLIATKKGKGPSVMLSAHMDEVGLSAKYIDENGFIYFIGIGGWFEQTLLNQRVTLHGTKGVVPGVIGSKPPHILEEEEKKKPIPIKDMFIDIGAASAEDANSLGVTIGTPITIDRQFTPLSNNLVTGKALDDRAGCAMMIEAIKRTEATTTIFAVGSTQEEVGLKGAKTASFGLNPDVAIATETSIAGDHPGIEKKMAHLELGKGPSVTVVDGGGRGLITPDSVLRWIEETAATAQITCQRDVSSGGTTDATAINLTRAGIPAGVVSVVTRYLHTPVEVLNLEDLDAAAELIARMLETVGDFF
ncbi:MAG: M42 family metallopeptidase [Euryarchaeota archaeon]